MDAFDGPLGAAYTDDERIHEDFGRHHLIEDADGIEYAANLGVSVEVRSCTITIGKLSARP